jgi:hypothetical protein
MRSPFGRRSSVIAVTIGATACMAATFTASPVHAQSGPPPTPTQSASAPRQTVPDFLFGRPHAWVSLTGTWLFPRASGDLFSFVANRLTIQRSDFHARAVSGAVGVSITPRLDIVTEIEVSRRAIGSEYRDFVKPDRSPIAQTTNLNQSTILVGARFLPLGRGREISRYAFIPRRVTPYVGAGLNLAHYAFAQNGEFVDFVDLKIFRDSFRSDGWGNGPYTQAGADVHVWRDLFVNLDARYGWAHARLDSDFVGFDGIDLAGFKGSTGISVVF